jgi:hypothetical protein
MSSSAQVRHSFELLPALPHGDFMLYENSAIATYGGTPAHLAEHHE